MLAIPDEVKSCAKLLSPADEPSGTPSSRICVPEAPSSTPLPPLSSSAPRSSFHAVSNCWVVFAWPNSYSRANFSRMFRLRTNARAPPRVSGLMTLGAGSCPSLRFPYGTSPLSAVALLVSQIASPLLTADSLLSTLVSPSFRHKPPRACCTHLNNSFPCQFGNIVAAAANFVLPLHARPPEMLGRIAILPGMSFAESPVILSTVFQLSIGDPKIFGIEDPDSVGTVDFLRFEYRIGAKPNARPALIGPLQDGDAADSRRFRYRPTSFCRDQSRGAPRHWTSRCAAGRLPGSALGPASKTFGSVHRSTAADRSSFSRSRSEHAGYAGHRCGTRDCRSRGDGQAVVLKRILHS